MAGKDVTIRAQALDGTWQTIGSERARGVLPEGVTLEADQWGSLATSFNLRRDPTAFWPDITAFTPIEVDVGSRLVWSGRVKETPSQVAQRLMTMQCEGWQFHLDDDIYQQIYVHTRVSDWKDMKSFLDAPLTIYTTAPQVSAGDGVATLAFPANAVLANATAAGVCLDLGPTIKPKYAWVEFDYANPTGNTNLVFQIVSGDAVSPTSAVAQAGIPTGPGSSNMAGAINSGNGHRYVILRVLSLVGSNLTPTADVYVRIRRVHVFAESSYQSGGESTLKASDVVRDALGRATVLLSDDLSGIADTSFNLSSYAPPRQTARQAWSSVDANHDWLKQIDVERKPIYKARPTRPIFEVGVWSAINDDDASANSGADIYNRADAGFTGPSGSPGLRERFHGQDGEGSFSAIDAPSFANPSFATNTTGWSGLVGGAITRTTTAGEFDSSPAGGKLTVSSGIQPGYVTTTLSGVAKRGRVYRITARIRTATTNPFFLPLLAINGTGPAAPAEAELRLPVSTAGAFITATLLWRPTADTTNPVVYSGTISDGVTPSIVYIDSTLCEVSAASLVDRRGFTRAMSVPIQSTLPDDGLAADKIGDVWLADHKTTAFRGTITLVGDESLRDVLTGAPVPLETLLLSTGQLLRFSDRADPDTAGQGRDGRIAHVSYTPATNTAVVTIDNSRTSFDALMARLAVIQGG